MVLSACTNGAPSTPQVAPSVPSQPATSTQPAQQPQEVSPPANIVTTDNGIETPVPAPVAKPTSDEGTSQPSAPVLTDNQSVETPQQNEDSGVAVQVVEEKPEIDDSSQASVTEPEPELEQDPFDGLFFLSLISPDEDTIFIESPTYTVSGKTRIDATVSVNDDLIDVNENGIFSALVTLEEGPNIVEVVASVEAEEQSAVLIIFYLPEEGG